MGCDTNTDRRKELEEDLRSNPAEWEGEDQVVAAMGRVRLQPGHAALLESRIASARYAKTLVFLLQIWFLVPFPNNFVSNNYVLFDCSPDQRVLLFITLDEIVMCYHGLWLFLLNSRTIFSFSKQTCQANASAVKATTTCEGGYCLADLLYVIPAGYTKRYKEILQFT